MHASVCVLCVLRVQRAWNPYLLTGSQAWSRLWAWHGSREHICLPCQRANSWVRVKGGEPQHCHLPPASPCQRCYSRRWQHGSPCLLIFSIHARCPPRLWCLGALEPHLHFARMASCNHMGAQTALPVQRLEEATSKRQLSKRCLPLCKPPPPTRPPAPPSTEPSVWGDPGAGVQAARGALGAADGWRRV